MRELLRDRRMFASLYGALAALACYAYAVDAGFEPALWTLIVPALIASTFSILVDRLRPNEPEASTSSMLLCGIYLFAWTFRSWIAGELSAGLIFIYLVLYGFGVLLLTAFKATFTSKAKPQS